MKQNLSLIKRIVEKYDFLSPFQEYIERIEEKENEKIINVVFTGEFSSGKTSLINKLFNLSLPIDVLPETASIWKIILGPEEKIEVVFRNNERKVYTNVNEVKSLNPQDIRYINYYLPSAPSDLIIVDTPGLSSLNEFHKKVLDEFIDEADVLLVIVDVNQGLTKTTEEFVKKQIEKNIESYIVLTKTDTKPPKAVEELKSYIIKKFPELAYKVIKTSVKNNDLKELENILNEISQRKEVIVNKRIEYLLKLLCKDVRNVLNLQLKNADIDLSDLDKRETELLRELDEVEIKFLEMEKELKEKVYRAIQRSEEIFKNSMLGKVDWIVEALYDENVEEEVEDRLRKAIEESMEFSIQVLEKELQDLPEFIKGYVERLKGDITLEKDLVYIVADTIVRLRELILDLISILIFRIPKVGKIIFKVFPILREPINWVLKGATKKFIKDKIKQSIEKVSYEYSSIIKDAISAEFDRMKEDVLKDLKLKKESIEKAIQEIRKRKQEKFAEFDKYVSSIKNDLRSIEELCLEGGEVI